MCALLTSVLTVRKSWQSGNVCCADLCTDSEEELVVRQRGVCWPQYWQWGRANCQAICGLLTSVLTVKKTWLSDNVWSADLSTDSEDSWLSDNVCSANLRTESPFVRRKGCDEWGACWGVRDLQGCDEWGACWGVRDLLGCEEEGPAMAWGICWGVASEGPAETWEIC